MSANKQKKSNSDFELSITKELKQRKNPFLRPIFTVAAIGGLFLILASILQMKADSDKEVEKTPDVSQSLKEIHLTTYGESVCIKCTLNLSDQHHRAIRCKDDQLILLRNHPDMDMNLDYFCNGPTPCLIEGDIATNGLRILTPTAFKAFPEERK